MRHPEKRARNHESDIVEEEPLLLHPEKDTPEDHITFAGPTAIAVNNSVRDNATIDLLALNRPALVDSRLEVLKPLLILKIIADDEGMRLDLRKKALRYMEIASAPSSAYSAMSRANVP